MFGNLRGKENGKMLGEKGREGNGRLTFYISFPCLDISKILNLGYLEFRRGRMMKA